MAKVPQNHPLQLRVLFCKLNLSGETHFVQTVVSVLDFAPQKQAVHPTQNPQKKSNLMVAMGECCIKYSKLIHLQVPDLKNSLPVLRFNLIPNLRNSFIFIIVFKKIKLLNIFILQSAKIYPA